VIYMYLGEVVECGLARELFEHPKDARTQAYIGGEI
jgi:ABC-type phosphate transport system ATPase subunit